MKKLKKALICAAACVTACSFTALTACTENKPNTGLSSDVTVSQKLSASELDAQISRFNSQSASSFTVSGEVNLTRMGEEAVDIAFATISAKANLEGGNADIALAINSLFFGDEESPNHDFEYTPSTQAEGEAEAGGEEGTGEGTETGTEEGGEEGGEVEAPEMMEMSVFIRDWVAFYPNTDEAVDGVFNYKSLADSLNGSGMTIDEVVSQLTGGFVQDNATLLKIANTTDSIVVDEAEHTVTFNINKMVYGLYDYIKQIANNITETTTVSGLLKCSAVKYYLETFLGDMTGEQLFETVMGVIAGGGTGGEIGGTNTPFAADIAEENPLAAIMPNQGEKAYDYIMRMLDSQEFATITGAETPIGATKIVEMIGEDAAQALDIIKGTVAMVEQTKMITETSLTIPQMPGMAPAMAGTSISDMKLVYTFDEQDVLQSVGINGKVGMTVEGTAAEMEVSLTVAFAAEAITGFENIGSYTVNVYDETESTMIVKTVNEILGKTTKQ